MSTFVPRWSDWDRDSCRDAPPERETVDQATSKTCKTSSAGFAGPQDDRLGQSFGARDAETAPNKSAQSRAATRTDADRSTAAPAVHHGESGVLTADRVAGMSLDEFASAGLIVTVNSRALGCQVLFVSDDVADERIDTRGLAVYRVHELRKLAIIKPEPRDLRNLHEVKAVFGGVIEGIDNVERET